MPDRETINIYGSQVQNYIDITPSAEESASLKRFVSHLKPGARILDFGCGPGHHAEQMLKLGFEVSALDATPEFVENACARGVDARVGTFDDLTETAQYDAIWASFSLLHAPKADFPRYLDAIHQTLKPSGHLFLGLKLGAGEKRDSLGRFYSYYQEDELRTALDKALFQILGWTSGEGVGLAGDISPFALITAKRIDG